MATSTSIESSLEERLHRLDTEQIPRLEADVADGDEAAVAQLAGARRERSETLEALDHARALRRDAWDDERIEVGDTVELLEVGSDETERYVIVWETGARISDAWISHTSPVGRAVVGSTRGDVVTIDAPGGTTSYRIVGFSRTA